MSLKIDFQLAEKLTNVDNEPINKKPSKIQLARTQSPREFLGKQWILERWIRLNRTDNGIQYQYAKDVRSKAQIPWLWTAVNRTQKSRNERWDEQHVLNCLK